VPTITLRITIAKPVDNPQGSASNPDADFKNSFFVFSGIAFRGATVKVFFSISSTLHCGKRSIGFWLNCDEWMYSLVKRIASSGCSGHVSKTYVKRDYRKLRCMLNLDLEGLPEAPDGTWWNLVEPSGPPGGSYILPPSTTYARAIVPCNTKKKIVGNLASEKVDIRMPF
jgi:hypothetical protein